LKKHIKSILIKGVTSTS